MDARSLKTQATQTIKCTLIYSIFLSTKIANGNKLVIQNKLNQIIGQYKQKEKNSHSFIF